MPPRRGNGKVRRVIPRVMLHVEPSTTRPGHWMVRRENAARPMRILAERDAATRHGHALARKRGWDLVVHRVDGTVEESVSYATEAELRATGLRAFV